ncbi:hypothetical protein DFQ28_009522 [Apophysomyces sp. BC1034]|nr:hypothetical protein DFQ30_009205 [Apophysomyces sp. BC1015]KAG0181648.1 hypothetical protein DFQ29_007634 [Apophysomyces sp. BC1021]KAG0192296.1 hypothetical protein DFQ28_009522 [Apophysomyces sp. BC1034]
MTEYNYTVSKEAKAVPLYHHEQVPFQSIQRHQTKQIQLSSQDQQDSWRHHPSTTTTTTTNPASYDLQDVIIYYQSQPELLRLILLSKLEEDKRRAEEAKLRAKELDLMLLQQQQLTPTTQTDATSAGIIPSPPPFGAPFGMQPTPPPSTDGRPMAMRRTSLDAILASPHMPSNFQRRESAAMGNTDALDDRATFPMSSYAPPLLSLKPQTGGGGETLSPTYMDENSFPATAAPIGSNTRPLPPPPSLPQQQHHHQQQHQRIDAYTVQRPRRRREMQAITKIVETREFPYVDGYFWKNNGNTIQKKTGNKSVYYKCSNSSKGCPVNKTVTWKENGEYLIKYRGEHLMDCGKVQRIVDM